MVELNLGTNQINKLPEDIALLHSLEVTKALKMNCWLFTICLDRALVDL